MKKRLPTPRCEQAGFPIAAVLSLGADEVSLPDTAAAARANEIASFCLGAWLRAANQPMSLDQLNDSFQRVHAKRMEIAGELARLIDELKLEPGREVQERQARH